MKLYLAGVYRTLEARNMSIQKLYQEKELLLENSILNAKNELQEIRNVRKENAKQGGI